MVNQNKVSIQIYNHYYIILCFWNNPQILQPEVTLPNSIHTPKFEEASPFGQNFKLIRIPLHLKLSFMKTKNIHVFRPLAQIQALMIDALV